MRLLDVETLAFTDFHAPKVPKYAIASHRWAAGAELMFSSVQEGRDLHGYGYQKVKGFADYIKTHIPGVAWLWIDTCCIDQKSSTELAEAINSMFRWYRDAEVCLAYLQDVATPDDMASFDKSNWFSRGWTLQELIAPSVVVFLTQKWKVIGHKGQGDGGRSDIQLQTGPLLDGRIAVITRIPETILQDYNNSRNLSVEEKLQWSIHRETTREEDLSYCLLGILEVSMNIRYGDGREVTRARLLKKVHKRAIERPEELSSGLASLASLAAQLAEDGRRVEHFYNAFTKAPVSLKETADELLTFGHALRDLERDRQSHSPNPMDFDTLQRCMSIANRASGQIHSSVDKLEAIVQMSKVEDRMNTEFGQTQVQYLCNELDRAKNSLAFAYQLYTESRRKSDTNLVLRMLADNGRRRSQRNLRSDTPGNDLQSNESRLMVNPQITIHTNKGSPNGGAFEIVQHSFPAAHGQSKRNKLPSKNRRFRFSPWFASRIWEISLETAQVGWTVKLWTSNLVPGDALILEACRDGDLPEVQRLFSEGMASPYDRCSDDDLWLLTGSTTLSAAAASGNVELCQYLIGVAGYPMSLRSIINPLLMYQLSMDSSVTKTSDILDMYRLLLKYSGPYLADEDFMLGSHVCWQFCPNISCVRMLKDHFNSDIEDLRWELQVDLAFAGSEGHGANMPTMFLEILGLHEADERIARAHNVDGQTVLHTMAMNMPWVLDIQLRSSWSDFIRSLIDSGADLCQQSMSGKTPFMYIWSHTLGQQTSIWFQSWLELLEAAGVDLDTYGRRESPIWQTLHPSGFKINGRRIKIHTYGPEVKDWTLVEHHERLEVQVPIYHLDCPPGAWTDRDDYMIKTICWDPQSQEYKDPWPWRKAGELNVSGRPSALQVNEVDEYDDDNDSLNYDAHIAGCVGTQDDCGGIIRLIHESSNFARRPRRRSDPLISRGGLHSYPTRRMPQWLPDCHFCRWDGKLRLFSEHVRKCVVGIHDCDIGILWDSVEGISRQMRRFRRRYRGLSELRSLPYEAYHPIWKKRTAVIQYHSLKGR